MHCGKYGCESSNVCWWYMCVQQKRTQRTTVLVGCNVFWIFVATMLLNTKSLLTVTKQLVFFFAQKSITTCPIKCFSKWCTCTIFRPSEISWCVDKCIIKGWWWHSETSEITIGLLCSKQTQRHFWSVLSCSKKHFISCLLHANVCLPIVEQIHAD